ncbi:(2Fe-2S)-binding protein [Embleya sp. NBC_00896]|uniref:(2Fe-2S)-binding protein n=1 Tax=Embleya sp. NBC_00896 TaxID=2975961 RepID=UPI00386F4743|nr:(2Fe-2S)-binding protein [Embleya sp. NBC_00896]
MASGRQPLTGARAVLDRVARVGPYFAVRTGSVPDETGFRPLADLYDREAPHALADRVEDVRAKLGTDEVRVAASILFLGVASRLWSVALGAAVLGRGVPELDPASTSWRFPASGPVELWAPDPGWVRFTDDASAVGALHDAVMDRHVVPLAAATRAVVPVAERLLWGNAASALVGATRVLSAHVAARPELAASAEAFADGLLATGRLRGTGPRGTVGTFRRTTCCLYYRIPGGGICGDCVFGASGRSAPPRPAPHRRVVRTRRIGASG